MIRARHGSDPSRQLISYVEFDKPPTAQPWGTFAILKDSEGNQFVLSTPR